MFLCYFDEVKTQSNRPHFFIGGIAIEDKDALSIEGDLNKIAQNFFGQSLLGHASEFHGEHIMRGKGSCKNLSVSDRISLFENLMTVLQDCKIQKFLTRIDVSQHRRKYKYPEPEYNLGLMLHIEMIDKYLEGKKSLGMMFGDVERDETNNSIVSLSQFRAEGTNFYKGRLIKNLLDTLHFAHSHHSRFIQLADVFMYLNQLDFYDDGRKSMQNAVLKCYRDSGTKTQISEKTWP